MFLDDFTKGSYRLGKKIKIRHMRKYIVLGLFIILLLALWGSARSHYNDRDDSIKLPGSGLSKVQGEKVKENISGDTYGTPDGKYTIKLCGEMISSRNNILLLEDTDIYYVVYEGEYPDDEGYLNGVNTLAQYDENVIPKVTIDEEVKDMGFVGTRKVEYRAGQYEFEYKFSTKEGYYCFYAVDIGGYSLYVMGFSEDAATLSNSLYKMQQSAYSIEEITEEQESTQEDESSDLGSISRDYTISYTKDYDKTYFVVSYTVNGETPVVTLTTPEGEEIEADKTYSSDDKTVFVIESAQKGDYIARIRASKGRFVTDISYGAYSSIVYDAMYGD